jgi:16S rRNA C967 or C1407 C5-methylase (RsmB/RsmF family)
MTEATNLMKKAAGALFPGSEDEQALFLRALLDPVARGSAIVWTGPRREGEFDTVDRATLPSWVPDSIEVVRPGVKVGKSPAYEAGEVYPLDLSSVITGSAMLAARDALPDGPRVLDLCAAPGGKSILASVLLHPSLILANEVEGKRLGMLRHNLSRCRIANAHTQRLDPAEIARLAPEAFDLSLIDAPCSGQSLLAKGIENPGCFHPSTVKGNARRQSWILAAAAETVRPGGFLLYTTCTFAGRENEGVIEKLLESRPDFGAVEVPHLADLRSPLVKWPCYRVYPHRSAGAGGFAALLCRSGERPDPAPDPLPPPLLDYPVAVSGS